MPKLHSSAHICKILEQHDFRFISQKGSHAKYKKSTDIISLVVIIPINKKEIPMGTFHSILRQSHLDKSAFE